MAKRTVTTIIDDIDGSEAAESITFSFRGVNYGIDLSARNAAAFDKAMSKWIGSATRESGRRQTSRTTTPSGRDLADIRAWATANGWNVAERGRIASEVVEAYDAHHGR